MSGIWWLALYPSAAVIAVYMWICGKKRSYLDGVAAVQANSDDIESVGTCVHSVCIMTDPWTTAEMMKRFKGKVVGFVSLRPVPHTLYAAPAPRCFPLPVAYSPHFSLPSVRLSFHLRNVEPSERWGVHVELA